MKKAVIRAINILNEKIAQNKMHDGKFELKVGKRPDQSGSIGLYYTDNKRYHTVALIITSGGGYDFFYDQLISALPLLKTAIYENPERGYVLEVYQIGELMNKGTFNYKASFNKIKAV